jgi:sterol desaturase/sphingolipid hydroxylase (fatty acid hydroxylase superfamily)
MFVGSFAAFCLLDILYKSRTLPTISLWKIKGVVAFILAFYLTAYSPYIWDDWFGKHRLIDATHMPLISTVLIGLLMYELGIYAWHRASHAFQPMWRWSHQVHHSVERIDVYSALYFHPLDILGFSLLGSLTLVMVFGVSPTAASIIGSITNVLAVFQHANIKTPHWLGYFVIRPEAHNVHHKRGFHFKNFGDIPHWDMLFGTYYNPATSDVEVGFFEGSSSRLGDMLMGRDISMESDHDRDASGDRAHDSPAILPVHSAERTLSM